MSYLKRLADHPGVPYAAIFSVAGFFAGLERGSFTSGLVGMAIMSIFWVPVLLTARK